MNQEIQKLQTDFLHLKNSLEGSVARFRVEHEQQKATLDAALAQFDRAYSWGEIWHFIVAKLAGKKKRSLL